MQKRIGTYVLLLVLAAWIGCSPAPRPTPERAPVVQPPAPAREPVPEPAPVVQPPAPESATMQQEMVNRHNYWRSQVGAPALRWSATLAAFAQEWADELANDGCSMVHRDQQQYGENLKWASAQRSSSGARAVQAVPPTQIVDEWAAEEQWYTYETNGCQADQECGHYTQVVWAKTQEVGCAMAVCPDKAQIWVCNYDPPGNMDGEKPY